MTLYICEADAYQIRQSVIITKCQAMDAGSSLVGASPSLPGQVGFIYCPENLHEHK